MRIRERPDLFFANNNVEEFNKASQVLKRFTAENNLYNQEVCLMLTCWDDSKEMFLEVNSLL